MRLKCFDCESLIDRPIHSIRYLMVYAFITSLFICFHLFRYFSCISEFEKFIRINNFWINWKRSKLMNRFVKSNAMQFHFLLIERFLTDLIEKSEFWVQNNYFNLRVGLLRQLWTKLYAKFISIAIVMSFESQISSEIIISSKFHKIRIFSYKKSKLHTNVANIGSDEPFIHTIETRFPYVLILSLLMSMNSGRSGGRPLGPDIAGPPETWK